MNMSYQHKIEALEQQREGLQKKHQRDMESLNLEVQDKKLQVQRQQSQISDLQDVKNQVKQQNEEYEDKIKTLIKEFEDESKKHIKEVNEIHEHYRTYKTRAKELEQRIDQYKSDCQMAQKSERLAKKELV